MVMAMYAADVDVVDCNPLLPDDDALMNAPSSGQFHDFDRYHYYCSVQQHNLPQHYLVLNVFDPWHAMPLHSYRSITSMHP